MGIEGVEGKIGVVGTVVEEAGMKDVPRCEVVLQAKEIVAGPLLGGLGARRLLFHHVESVLDADGIGKPEAAALDGAREREPGIPVAEMRAFLKVDPR